MEKDLSGLKVKELRDQLRKLGLTVSGNKAELIKRIESHNINAAKVFPTYITDVDREILLNLNIGDMLGTCKTNKYASKLCTDEQFLRLRLQRTYNDDANEALIDASQYGDYHFVKYLVEKHKVSLKYRKYKKALLFLISDVLEIEDYDILRHLIKYVDVNNLEKILLGAVYLDLNYMIAMVVKSGLMIRLIDANKDKEMLRVFNKFLDKADSITTFTEPDNIEYINMLRYLYENLGKSTYLKVLTDLLEGDEHFGRFWSK